MNFGPLYSAGYNLLNEGKDYKKELDFVFETISAIVGSEFIPKSVIDFGNIPLANNLLNNFV